MYFSVLCREVEREGGREMYFSILCREVEREGGRECTFLNYVEKWKGKGVGNVLLCIM